VASRVRRVVAVPAPTAASVATIGNPAALRLTNRGWASWAVAGDVRVADPRRAARRLRRRLASVPYKRKPVTNQAIFPFIW